MYNLEFSRRKPLRIWAKQGDTGRELELQCISDSLAINLTGCTVTMNMVKPVLVFANASIVDATAGKIRVDLTSSMLSQKGIFLADISIFLPDGKLLSSANFELDIDASQMDGDATEASDEFSALVNAMGDITQVKSQLAQNKTQIKENIMATAPSRINNASLITSYTGVLPLCYKNGVLYGFKNNTTIVKSTNEGDTWFDVATTPAGSVHSIYFTNDGEVLICNATSIWKSNGWSVNPLTATWGVKVTKSISNGVGIIPWSFDGDGNKFIATEYSGADRSQSRYIWVSTDKGNTFNIVYDKNTTDPENTSHIHGVCYDKWADRFFVSHGHGTLRGVYYSDDNGASWNKIGGDFQPDAAPTTLTATDNGIVCGSDSGDGGLYGIKRTENPSDMRMEPIARWYVNRPGVTGFAYRSVRDEETGQVYVSFKSDFDDVYSVIMAGTATNGATIWVSPNKALSSFTYLAVTSNRILGLLTENNVATFIKATKPSLGVSTFDKTNALSGASRNATSIAIGNDVNVSTNYEVVIGSMASIIGANGNVVVGSAAKGKARSVAIGSGAEAISDDSIVIGCNTKITDNSPNAVVIGSGSNVYPGSTNGVAIGKIATSTFNGVAVGYNAKAGDSISHTGSTAIGNSSVAGGNAVAIGSSAKAGTGQVAVGQNATSTHSNSVALGKDSVTTAADQLQLGAKHIEIDVMTTEPGTAGASKMRLFARLNTSSKIELCAKIGSQVIVIATQP